MPRHAPLPSPPPPSASWAYFLDFDGTLVELMERPDAAYADDDVLAIVASLTLATEGAVALISGRAIPDLVSRFGTGLYMAGQHGAERLMSDGRFVQSGIAASALDPAREFIRHVLTEYPTLLLEDKGQSLALHYRRAPRLAAFSHHVMKAACERLSDGFRVHTGKRVVELRSGDRDKGDAIADFMVEPTFQHRRPVFIGDDRTDESAFAFINEQHGLSVKVGAGATAARWRLPNVRAVRRWLSQVDSQMARHVARQVIHADT